MIADSWCTPILQGVEGTSTEVVNSLSAHVSDPKINLFLDPIWSNTSVVPRGYEED